MVGVVPCLSTRVYKVKHEDGVVNVAEEQLTLECFHHRMGHISPEAARQLVKNRMVTGIQLEYATPRNPFFCASCIHAKATCKPVPKLREGEQADVFGGEVHSDLWGKLPVELKGGKFYYITFINDKTHLTHLYLLRTKDETPRTYKKYDAWVEMHMGAKIKVFNTDRGGEYQGAEFVKHLKSKGTQQKLNMHDMPQQAGVAECCNRTIGKQIWACCMPVVSRSSCRERKLIMLCGC